MKRSIIFKAFLAAIALICLHGASAWAQNPLERSVYLACNQKDVRYPPSITDSSDVIDVPTTADPTVATGVRRRIGGGTAGQIEISAGHTPGTTTTTVTYHVRGFSDRREVEVHLIVTVFCPDFPTPPPTPTHIVARCPACQNIANKMNGVADDLSDAVDKLRKDEKTFHDAYDSFSKKTPTSDDSLLEALQALRDKVNADMANIRKLQMDMNGLVKDLADCEKNCNLGAFQPPKREGGGGGDGSGNVTIVSHATPTRRTTNCAPCQVTVDQLNDSSAKLAKAQTALEDLQRDDHVDPDVINEARQQVGELKAEVQGISKELDECEKKCSVSPGTPSQPQGTPVLKSMTIGLVVPKDVPQGQTVSGRVVANPDQYKNIPGVQVVEATVPEPTDGSLSGVVLETPDGKKQTADKPILLATAIGGGAAAILISTLDHPEVPPTAATVPVSTPTEPITHLPPVEYTSSGITEKVQEIQGPLSGDSTLTTATLDGKPATILAAKPGAVYVDTSEATATGAHEIVLHPAGQSPVTLTTRVVRASATVASELLHRGQSTEMSLTVDAGQISPSDAGTVSVKLINETPGIIKIAGKQELTFDSKQLAKGPLTTRIKLQAVGEGSFGVGWVMTPAFKPNVVPAKPITDNTPLG